MTSSPRTGLSFRAAVHAGNGRVRLEPRPTPAPAAGELILRLRCAGLCGTDLFKLADPTLAPGVVLGHELVGEVEALGEGVGQFALGDRIVVPHHVACGGCPWCLRDSATLCSTFRENQLAPGAFSERILVRERAVRLAARRLPPDLADESAVFLEPAACVLRGIRKSGIQFAAAQDKTPAWSIVLGGGGMGLLHLLVLKAIAPEVRVALSDPLADRRTCALELGADLALDPAEPQLDRRLRAAGVPEGADVVFDCVGGPEPLASALALARPGGTIVLFAHAGANARGALDLNEFFKHERRLVGSYSGALSEQREIWDLLSSHRLDPSPLVSHRLPLSRFEEGVDLARRHRALKVLFVPDEDAA